MPALSASYNVNSPTADTTTLVTPPIALLVGDVVVVKAVTWDDGLLDTYSDLYGDEYSAGTPTDTQGNTYTQQVVDTSGAAYVTIWTTVVATSAPMTVSAYQRSMVVERWASAALDVTPVATSATGTGVPTATITTSQPASAVTWCSGDAPGQDPAGCVYNATSATPIEDGLHSTYPSAGYVAYYAYQQAASAGSQTVGLTAPTGQTWALAAMEVLNVEPGVDPEQPYVAPLAWQ